MQLFYHGTRDIELPPGSRRAPAPASARRCEACGRPLTADDASETGSHGVALCADCRNRLDRSAIQIHFCDGCGVSIPLDAVQTGTAVAADGRILCGACRKVRPARRGLSVRWVAALAVAALALGALVAWLL